MEFCGAGSVSDLMKIRNKTVSQLDYWNRAYIVLYVKIYLGIKQVGKGQISTLKRLKLTFWALAACKTRNLNFLFNIRY